MNTANRGRKCLEAWSAGPPVVAPSMLLCDFGHLEREVRTLEDAGARSLHLDVMDGLFVPNSTYGVLMVETLRRLTDLPLDVHAMIREPERQVKRLAEAGADAITCHVEATDDAPALLSQVAETGCAAGIALNPETPLSSIDNCLGLADIVLVMSVSPGFGGQSFRPVALEKLQSLRATKRSGTLLGIDGGVNLETVPSCVRAGAAILVIGSAIFRADDYRQAMGELERVAAV